jgi:Immunoglobulin domain
MNRIRFLSPTLGFASGGNLHIYSVPLGITEQPQSQTVIGPTNVTFSVSAVGNPPISYQWFKNGTNAPGATGPMLTLPAVLRTDAGTYSVFVANGFSSLQSSNAVLRVFLSERFGQPMLLPGNRIQLLFNDADGGAMLTSNDVATFHVFASTNLINWFSITNALTLTNGSVIFQDSLTNAPHRFYRVLEQ